MTTSSDLNVHLMHKQYYKQQHIQSSALNPNRHSHPSANLLRPQQQVQMQKHQVIHEKPAVGAVRGGQRLSLDTSDERLQNITIVKHGNKNYLKLFSPSLVESPVSFLNQKQLVDDRKLWENGPDEAFQKQLEVEKREAYRARSKQQLRGFFMGLWLGCLMGLLILQQTSAKVYIWRHDSLSSYTPLVFLLILASSVAVVRSGTRCTIAAVATCAAVLTCFATLIVNQSRYGTETKIYKRVSTLPL
ncbi:hypothetical protein BGZ72_005314 [Mortierella alpina]|nr:hypothetical protein BGZ72_005314 [Mortierella alpina]